MNKNQVELDLMLTDGLKFFSRFAPLMVKHKDPSKGIVQFKFNNAQNILHTHLEDQKKRTGRVRAIVLKGRQQGVSTYVGARFYHKTSRRKANNTLIMTHLSDATANLFQMTKRYHDNTDERLRTPTKSSSQTGMEFDGLDSNYKVATAGSKEIGRSYTVTNFHMSEYAFYPDPDSIKAGALQTVPDVEGTEIIIESTANGMTNDFYTMCMNALKGVGEFELVFIPWFVQEEYRAVPYMGFELTTEEKELKRKYDLDIDQIYWRRKKIDSFSGKISKFRQEYPCNPYEAFQASGDALVDIDDIHAARKFVVKDSASPVVLGVDPASRGDRAVIAIRKGQELKNCIVFDTEKEPLEPMDFVTQIITSIKNHNPAKVFIDTGEAGYAILSRLKELGYGGVCVGVDFGQRALQNTVYENKRAEMWCALRDWLAEGNCSIPDQNDIQADIMSMPDYRLSNNSRIKLIPKQKIKEDFKMSPDIGDAIALTFAFPINPLSQTVKTIKTGFKPIKPLKVRTKK